MATIPITLVGKSFTDCNGNTTFVGQAFTTGLQVGGGPMPGGPPLGIWGGGGVGNYPDAGFPGPQPGQPPRPWGPINYPDQGLPGNQPIAGWGPGFPTPPIVIPRPPVDFPTPPPEGDKPPPEGGGWGYSSEYGWGYFPMQGGKPQPGAP